MAPTWIATARRPHPGASDFGSRIRLPGTDPGTGFLCPAAQNSLLSTYDASGSIPFLDVGNRFVINGASYSPKVQGLSRAQIAAELSDPTNQVGQAIDGAANNITVVICTLAGHQPGNVCDSPTITAIAKKLGA